MASASYGQAYFKFDNLLATGTITIESFPPAGYPIIPDEGANGDFPGSNYRASLYYSFSPPFFGIGDPAAFTPLASESTVPFYGTTGKPPNNGPNIDGAGYLTAALLQFRERSMARLFMWW
jgi:hypothetical protein